MQHLKKSIKVVNKADLVFCNMCGKKIEQQQYIDNYISVQKKWSYGSPHDGESHSFELCEECYEEFISKFKIKP